MTYGLTADGFIIKPFEAILSDLEDYLIENIGTGLTRDRLSVVGHLNTNDTQQFSELWEGLQAVYAAQNRDGASGTNLQYIGSLTGTYLNTYTKTTVAGRVQLNPLTVLPIGSVANLDGQSNVRFLTTTEVTATIAGGWYDVTFESENDGEIIVSPSQLGEISEAVMGWIDVDNVGAGVTGTQPETDPEFRTKQENEIGAGGSTSLTAILASVVRDTDCTGINGAENDTDLVDGYLLLPHSIHVVCKDGTSEQIAESIFNEKAAGIRTNGNEIETVLDHNEEERIVKFSYATEIPHEPQFLFSYDYENYTFDQMQILIDEILVDYYSALGVGDNLNADDLKCVIQNGIPGFIGWYLWAVSDVYTEYYEVIVYDGFQWSS